MRKSTRRVPDLEILLVTSDPGMAEAFRTYYESHYHYNSDKGFYETLVEATAEKAIRICATRYVTKHVWLVVLDVCLPDMSGYELAKKIRECSHPIGFVFLAENKATIPPSFEGECFVTKPFRMVDIEQGIERTRCRMHVSWSKNPWTRLPADIQLKDKLKSVLGQQDWELLCIEAIGIDAFENIPAVRLIADLIEETVDEYGAPHDFVGHIFGSDFVVITHSEKSMAISQALHTQFARVVYQDYSLKTPSTLVTLSIKTLRGSERPWGDVKEIVTRIEELTNLGEKVEALHQKNQLRWPR